MYGAVAAAGYRSPPLPVIPTQLSAQMLARDFDSGGTAAGMTPGTE